jgi:hypothetical protein
MFHGAHQYTGGLPDGRGHGRGMPETMTLSTPTILSREGPRVHGVRRLLGVYVDHRSPRPILDHSRSLLDPTQDALSMFTVDSGVIIYPRWVSARQARDRATRQRLYVGRSSLDAICHLGKVYHYTSKSID